MREAWTDERLDDLKEQVAEQTRRMDAGFAAGREELRREIGALRNELRGEIGELRAELHAMNRGLLKIGAGMIVTMALGFLSVIVTGS